ncbi:MAG: chromosome segregation protein SMC [Deltaproteobacteria bacterium]|nr:chromosome segregation protein SMC [Deltaproteobacteria bacterium]
MHIKQLEISGFKSFVDRTIIHFDHDLIGVVGPNGCGKSNVLDAIRWAMGEQSAKALRGRSMSDVIFNGSETRPPHGFAEVTVTFDNSEPEGALLLPLDYREYAELGVTRRLFRDGTSEYLINKSQVRLKDVTDVFLGTGVGRKAYSIVEQGKIGLIVSARPEDRRGLIEEAAGITKYKGHKRQAEQKMELTRHNLQRVGDIVAEIERQLVSLKRQAAKAKRYVRCRAQMEDLVLWDASHRWLELRARGEVARSLRDETALTGEAERAAVDAREAELEVARQQAYAAEQLAEQAQQDAFLADNDAREHDARIERARDRYRLLEERRAAARAEQEDLGRKAGAMREERRTLSAARDSAEAEREREAAGAQLEQQRLAEVGAADDRATAELGRARTALAEAAARIATALAELGALERRAAELAERQHSGALQLDEIERELGEARGRHGEAQTRVAELRARRDELGAAQAERQAELASLAERHAEQGRQLDAARAEQERRRSRLGALRELCERWEWVGAGPRALLQRADPAVLGLVADRIDVPDEYAAAVAGLLGERLQTVVVAETKRALELLAELGQQDQGRAAIICPQDLGPDLAQGPAPAASEADGVLGPVGACLRPTTADDRLVRALVGDAVLVRTVDAARKLRERGARHDMVTLDGTVFHADGRISGGAGDKVAWGALAQRREMRELAHELDTQQEALHEASSCAEALEVRRAELAQALEGGRQEKHAAEIALAHAEQEERRAEERLAATTARRAVVAEEIAQLGAALQQAQAEHAEAQQARAASSADEAAAREMVAQAEQACQRARAELAAQQARLTERRILFARAQELSLAASAALERAQRTGDELGARFQDLGAERERAAAEAGELGAAMVQAQSELVQARARARQARGAFDETRLALDEARSKLGLGEAELKQKRAALGEVQQRLQEHEMELQRLQLELGHLEESVAERFRGLRLRRVVGDYHARPIMDEEQRRRIGRLLDLLDHMGPVNLEAEKEHNEADERHRFFTKQQADLTQAMADLERAIAQMNRESRRRFRHAFEGISARFEEIFPKLFRGGRASLQLTSPNDLLETGIEILAQPPGKKLSNIELMSGGEKAFTAVALLFAIFQYKPSPFCILDEVDAPLDDANVDRYLEGIRGMTDRSQFILITHSKRTMQAVDVLYGVTMQEPGVSRLVGVRVSEGRMRSQRPRDSVAPLAGDWTGQDEPGERHAPPLGGAEEQDEDAAVTAVA